MTDPAPVELAETCRCGASTTVKTPGLTDARTVEDTPAACCGAPVRDHDAHGHCPPPPHP